MKKHLDFVAKFCLPIFENILLRRSKSKEELVERPAGLSVVGCTLKSKLSAELVNTPLTNVYD